MLDFALELLGERSNIGQARADPDDSPPRCPSHSAKPPYAHRSSSAGARSFVESLPWYRVRPLSYRDHRAGEYCYQTGIDVPAACQYDHATSIAIKNTVDKGDGARTSLPSPIAMRPGSVEVGRRH